ncbi:MAG: hypothetical protein KC561_07785, partial [Myxococcales bacterium]|nr:hypothetical protein [Myxococcales bacterium]
RVRIGAFKAHNFDELKKGVERLPLSAYFPRNSRPVVRASCAKSALYHSDAVAERAGDAAASRLGGAPGGQQPTEASLYVRLYKDEASVSVDAAHSLFMRGYRTHIGDAPLRETLAAACIWASGWGANLPLLDPFCGSGTILVEGLLRQCRAVTTPDQRMSFQDWPSHSGAAFSEWFEHLPQSKPTGNAFGIEIDPEAAKAADSNIERAGVTNHVRLRVGDALDNILDAPKKAFIVSNPPYGKRLASDRHPSVILQRFVERLAKRDDWSGVFLLLPPELGSALPGRWDTVATFSNRGTPVRLFQRMG